MTKLNRWVYGIVGVIICLCVGLVYAWSVMANPIAAEFSDWTKAELSLTFTLTMMMFCVGGLIAGFLNKKIKARFFIWISAILMFMGFLISANITSIGMLYFGFGILGGLAAGFAYSAVMGTVCAWFPDKQGLISGILLMGFGISSFLVGKLYAAYTPDYIGGWRDSFKFIAILLLIVLAVCGIFIKKPDADFKAPGLANQKKNVREPAEEIGTATMLKRPPFWFYYIWAVLISAAGLIIVSQASGIASQVGPEVGVGTIATVVGLISIFNGIGRVLFGALFDKVGYKKTMILDMVIFIAAGIIVLLAMLSGAFALIVIGYIIAGIAYGGVTPTNSAIISDFFGRKNFAMNFPVINTNLLFASFGSTIAGKLFDASGSYFSTMILFIGLVIVSFVIFLFIRRPKTKEQ
ncbi:MAG: OFA family MFS transporter [Lachnospiraceae bacterium]|nr:OFA family MFS transporter [Lachnospiraceae bacterium]